MILLSFASIFSNNSLLVSTVAEFASRLLAFRNSLSTFAITSSNGLPMQTMELPKIKIIFRRVDEI